MPAKKRSEVDSNAELESAPKLAPIVFKSPSLRLDTRLRVFEEEFHLHSVVLKMHSNYFRQFLDSADKTMDSSDSPLFKYDYATVIDEDGTWALEAARKAPPLTSEMKARIPSRHIETTNFQDLLRAMYNRPYKIHTIEQLRGVFKLADFYCALPILSATLTAALLGSKIFEPKTITIDDFVVQSDFARLSHEFLIMAKRIRNPIFFRDCLIHVVGQWSVDDTSLDDHPDLLRLVTKSYAWLCRDIMDCLHDIVYFMFHHPNRLDSTASNFDVDSMATRNPAFYVAVQHELVPEREQEDSNSLVSTIAILLRKRLSLE